MQVLSLLNTLQDSARLKDLFQDREIGLDGFRVAVLSMAFFGHGDPPGPHTPRMEANVLVHACVRNNSPLEDFHAMNPRESLRDPAAFHSFVDRAASNLAGMLAFFDVARLGGLQDFWKLFVPSYHRAYCSQWVTAPEASSARLTLSPAPARTGLQNQIVDLDALLRVAQGDDVVAGSEWKERAPDKPTARMEANVLLYLSMMALPVYERIVEMTEREGFFGDAEMKELMIEGTERLMHLLRVRDAFNAGDEWEGIISVAHATWCSDWNTEYAPDLALNNYLAELA